MVKTPKRRRIPGAPTPEEIHAMAKRRKRLGLPSIATEVQKRVFRLYFQRSLEMIEQEEAAAAKNDNGHQK